MTEKRVDESWKAQVEREKNLASRASPFKPSPSAEVPSGAHRSAEFVDFLSNLSVQAMVALGELPAAGSNQVQVNLQNAQYLIDLLGVLQGKTQGNLTEEESSLLSGLLYELRMKYAQKK